MDIFQYWTLVSKQSVDGDCCSAVLGGLLGGSPRSSFSYGTVANPSITNNGHAIQVALPEGFQSNVRIPVRGELQ